MSSNVPMIVPTPATSALVQSSVSIAATAPSPGGGVIAGAVIGSLIVVIATAMIVITVIMVIVKCRGRPG